MNEFERLVSLSKLDLDYSETNQDLNDITRLASRISGAEVALVNLIDLDTQWTVARHGLSLQQMRREDSVCQHTIEQGKAFELKGLRQDARFQNKDYVCAGPELNYYYGVPLMVHENACVGALCVLDKHILELNPEQMALLQDLAHVVVRRLEAMQNQRQLQERISALEMSQQKLGHDVRGPVSGILGMVSLLKEELTLRSIEGLDEMLELIGNSGQSVLELADSILRERHDPALDYNCQILARKLEQLYAPQALLKKITFSVTYDDRSGETTHFPSKSLLQIAGNLINNALKFTPESGEVSARIIIEQDAPDSSKLLCIEVGDNGVGMSAAKVDAILRGCAESDVGTRGERGYGLGLQLVRQLVDQAGGRLDLESRAGKGCRFTVRLPCPKVPR